MALRRKPKIVEARPGLDDARAQLGDVEAAAKSEKGRDRRINAERMIEDIDDMLPCAVRAFGRQRRDSGDVGRTARERIFSAPVLAELYAA